KPAREPGRIETLDDVALIRLRVERVIGPPAYRLVPQPIVERGHRIGRQTVRDGVFDLQPFSTRSEDIGEQAIHLHEIAERWNQPLERRRGAIDERTQLVLYFSKAGDVLEFQTAHWFAMDLSLPTVSSRGSLPICPLRPGPPVLFPGLC